MKIAKFRSVLLIVLCLFLCQVLQAQIRERYNQIKSSDPLTMSGSVGTNLGVSYNSNNTKYNSTPFTGTLFANLNFNIYSFNLPFSFYFVNNTTSFSHPQMPTFYLGMTPSWKKWRFYIGNGSMHFSNYTYSGLTFFGLGFEYQGELLRAGAFAGTLAQATRKKGFDDRSAFQQLADSLLGLNVPESDLPQYRREAIGAKIGVGNSKNYIDLSFLKAKDNVKSLPEIWQINDTSTIRTRDTIRAKDNLAIGLSGRFAIGSWFNFTANLGASLYTQDLCDTLSLLGKDDVLNKYIRKTDWLFGVRSNTQLRFAGDAAANFSSRVFNGSITYRFIQPDYTTLGVSSFSQNTHSLGLNTNFNMFKHKSILSLIGYIQRDNLDKQQMFTNQVATYTANWANNISEKFSFNISYNGIKQDQYDGLMLVPDSLRINQITHTASLSPVFVIPRKNDHSISLNFNFMQNSNLNKYSKTGFDLTSATAGVGYAISLEDIKLGVSGNYDFSYSQSESTQDYVTNALSVGLNYRIYSEEKINWNLNYNASVGYNTILKGSGNDVVQNEDLKINDVSFSNSLGSNFSYNKRHTASLYFSISNYSENVIFGQKIATRVDCRFTLSYTYTFAAKLIKKKNRKNKSLDE